VIDASADPATVGRAVAAAVAERLSHLGAVAGGASVEGARARHDEPKAAAPRIIG